MNLEALFARMPEEIPGYEAALAGPEATYSVRALELPPAKEAGKVIQGEDDPKAAAAELAKLLHEEAKVI